MSFPRLLNYDHRVHFGFKGGNRNFQPFSARGLRWGARNQFAVGWPGLSVCHDFQGFQSMEDLNGRYGLTPPHSEVVQACRLVEPCNALDMGCSSGRNALYLSQ
jgi:hypothetical protein